MRKEKVIHGILVAAFLLGMPCTASANAVWPSLYIVSGITSWYIIAAGLLIEFGFIKILKKTSWIKSVVIALVMNGFSALLGLVAIPISGLLAELALYPISSRTFALSHWIVSYILAVLCNVLIEGVVLKVGFKLGFRKNLWWLAVANAITVVIAMLAFGFTMDML